MLRKLEASVNPDSYLLILKLRDSNNLKITYPDEQYHLHLQMLAHQLSYLVLLLFKFSKYKCNTFVSIPR